MKQKVKIKLFSYRIACLDGITRRHNNIISAACETVELNERKTEYGHHMDCTSRIIMLSDYGATLDAPNYKEALGKGIESFKSRLKSVVYENDDIDFEVVDMQDYKLSFLNN